MLDGNYDSYFATDDDTKTVEIEFTLDGSKIFNRVQLQEYIPLGQRITSFDIQIKDAAGNWVSWGDGLKTTIGYKRIILGRSVTTDAVRVCITGALSSPVLNGFSLFNDSVSNL